MSIGNTIVNQIISYIFDNQFIHCTCPFCIKDSDQLQLDCWQQSILELIIHIDKFT